MGVWLECAKGRFQQNTRSTRSTLSPSRPSFVVVVVVVVVVIAKFWYCFQVAADQHHHSCRELTKNTSNLLHHCFALAHTQKNTQARHTRRADVAAAAAAATWRQQAARRRCDAR
jgi:ABC-type dipeptide/oligopeptide/nickel transport system permease component